MRRDFLKSTGSLAALVLAGTRPLCALAQASYPDRPIRIIIPFSAGGATDNFARVLGQKLSQVLGQSVYLENKTGAGSTLGADIVAKSSPDGYTLGMVAPAHVVGAHLYKKLPYHALNDFVAIARLVESPWVVVVHPDVKANTVKELIELSHKARLAYSTPGNGSTGHLVSSLFINTSGARLEHIPYKGSGGAMTDLIGGQVQMTFVGVVAALPYIRSGKLRPLAVTSAGRLRELPNVPTLDEAGLKGFLALPWSGLVAPAKTPVAVVSRLEAAVKAAMSTPEVKASLDGTGAEIAYTGSAEFGRFLHSEYDKWGKVIEQSGMTIN